MDKQGFIDNLNRHRRHKAFMIRIAMSVLFMALAGSMWMDKVHPHDGARTAYRAAAGVAVVVAVFLCLTAVQRLGRRLGLHCPHCDRSLSGPVGRKVLASDTCCHCGNRLF